MHALSSLALAATLLATHRLAAGEEARREPSRFSFSSSLQTWGYFNRQAAANDSPLNPDNAVLRIADEQFIADARLDMRMSFGSVDLIWQPRLYDESEQNGSGAHNQSKAGFRQAFARLRFGDGATVTAGRDVLAWGPANFRSPSSPFYFDSGKLNQLKEVDGVDLARIEQLAGPFSLSLGYVFDTPRRSGGAASDTGFMKIDFQSMGLVASANLARIDHRRTFIGGFGQYNLGDAWMLYAEYGYGPRARGMSIDASRQPPFTPNEPAASAASYLGGASYTLLNGYTVSLEYLYDRHGYSSHDQDTYLDLLEQYALAAGTSDPAVRGHSLGVLGLAAATTPALLGRKYLSLLWQSSLQETTQYWRLAATGNTHDGSGQLSGYFEKNLSPHFSIFFNGVRNVGARASEFNLGVEYVLSVGVKAFVF